MSSPSDFIVKGEQVKATRQKTKNLFSVYCYETNRGKSKMALQLAES